MADWTAAMYWDEIDRLRTARDVYRAEVERLRATIERAIVELRGTTAQGGDAEALLASALTARGTHT